MMYAYYRSDFRPPAEIFRDGFLPGHGNPEDITFSTALRKYPDNDSVSFIPDVTDSSVQDIYSPYAVCLSRKFESAAIFPGASYFIINSYIYVVLLPSEQSIQMQYGPSFGQSSIPDFVPNVVFNVHSLEVQQAQYISERLSKLGSAYDPKDVGWSLQAYECMTRQVTPEKILAAVKIERRQIPEVNKMHAMDLKRNIRDSYEKEFKVINVQINPGFRMTDPQLQQEILIELDSYLKRSSMGAWLRTPSFAYGLGGTFLPVPSSRPEWISLQDPSIPVMGDLVGMGSS